MRITATQPLFAWARLEDSPSLETVRRCLEAIPDTPLLQLTGVGFSCATWKIVHALGLE